MSHKLSFRFQVPSFIIQASIVSLVLLFLLASCDKGFHSVAAPKGYKKYSYFKQARIKKHAIKIGKNYVIRNRGGYDTGASGAQK